MPAKAHLECGHVVKTKTVTNDVWPSEYCPSCGKWVDVREYYREQWHSKCTVCTYSRSHGAARIYADSAAARHTRYTGHLVAVQWYAVTPPDLPPVSEPATLPGFPDEIPF